MTPGKERGVPFEAASEKLLPSYGKLEEGCPFWKRKGGK